MNDEIQRLRQTAEARAALAAERERLQPIAREFILWHRRRRGQWVPVANAGSYSAAFDAINAADKGHHGDWLVKVKGDDPNEARKAKA